MSYLVTTYEGIVSVEVDAAMEFMETMMEHPAKAALDVEGTEILVSQTRLTGPHGDKLEKISKEKVELAKPYEATIETWNKKKAVTAITENGVYSLSIEGAFFTVSGLQIGKQKVLKPLRREVKGGTKTPYLNDPFVPNLRPVILSGDRQKRSGRLKGRLLLMQTKLDEQPNWMGVSDRDTVPRW